MMLGIGEVAKAGFQIGNLKRAAFASMFQPGSRIFTVEIEDGR